MLFSGLAPSATEAQQPDYVRVFITLPSRITQTDRTMINNVGGDVRWEYVSSNTISVEVPERAIPYLERFAGRFLSIQLVPKVALADTLDWGADQINAEQVWGGSENANAISGGANAGSGAKVAVIDTGFDRDHPDLQANIGGGYNFVANNTNFEDDNGHGTHVGGTIAAADNGTGIIGVAPRASIYGLKVLAANGSGDLDDVIAALEWATGLNGGTKVDIINLSLGCYCDYTAMKNAVDQALANNVLVVAAAGNCGTTANNPSSGCTATSSSDTVIYPAKYTSAVAVASTTSSNARSSFSSVGPAVELAAPGSGIYSTYPNNTYYTLSGTSMATPHVAGLAALMKGAHPEWTAAQIRSTLQSTVTDLGSSGRDTSFGYGLVNAPAAVGASVTPPPPAAPFLDCTSQAAVTSSSGDNNGYEGNPANACTDGNGNATDTNSGTGTSTSCTHSRKDRHQFYNYNAAVNNGATINGIEVRLDAWAESSSSSPRLCVQLSWNGGVSWTTAKQTSTISNSEQTFILGSATDTWGRTWTSSDFSNANFRIRVIDVASNTSRDYRLDWVALRVTSTGGTAPLADTDPPAVSSTTPSNNATGVATNSTVRATFDEALDGASVTSSSFSLEGPGSTPVAGNVSYASNVATFTPSSALAQNTTYTARLTTAIEDSSGNNLESAYSWSFTTFADTAAPTLQSISPASNATGVAVSANIIATFSEPINQATLSGNMVLRDSSNNVVAGALTYANNVATFNPSSNLANSTTYTLTLGSGIEDVAGNPFSQLTRSFTTASAAAPTPSPTPSPTPPPSGNCPPVVLMSSDTLPSGAGTVSFSWAPVVDATSIDIRVQDANGSTRYSVVATLAGSATSWSGTDKSFDANYIIIAKGLPTTCKTNFDP